MIKKFSPWLLLVFLALVWRAIYAYWSLASDHYLVPPGPDGASHTSQIANQMNGHWAIIANGNYPQGFHILMALLAKVFGITAFQAVLWLTPLLLVIPILVVYFVGRKFFNSVIVGSVAASAWAVIALSPVRSYGDGNYPNLLAASVIMPLCILSIYRFVSRPSVKRAIISLLLVIMIAVTHHLTLGYMIIILAPWWFVMTVERFWSVRADRRALIKTLVGFFVIVLMVGVFILLYRGPLLSYLAVLKEGGNLSRYLAGDSNVISVMKELEINGPLLVIIGLVGLGFLMFSKENHPLKLLFASWILVLWLMGTVPDVGLPGRFIRELAIPLSLMIGYLAHFWYEHTPKLKPALLTPLLVITLLVSVWIAALSRPFALPDPYRPLMRLQHDEEAALPVLNQSSAAVIIANNGNPYLSYLVNKRVIIITYPTQVQSVVALNPSALIYIAERPPLTEDDPFYSHFDEIKMTMQQVPNQKQIVKLTNGSVVNRLSGPGY